MPTPHNQAKRGDFAKVVLMPGDPLRAKWIAETFLENPVLVNSVRNIFAYTGTTKSGKRVSVMASGMGMPSIGIYSHELFHEFGVEAIIRIGTCGSYQKDIRIGDVIIAQGSCTDSGWMGEYNLSGGTYSAIGDFGLIEASVKAAREKGKTVHVGNVLAADHFYNPSADGWHRWENLGVLAVEMESYALYVNAAVARKKALTILTVSDSFHGGEEMTPEMRQNGLVNMVEVALAAAETIA